MRDYKIIEAAPYCCIAASLESVLIRHGYNDITQYDIANEFGIVAHWSEEDKLPQDLTNVIYTNDVIQGGIHLSKDTLNNFFIKKGLPFAEMYIDWRSISEMNIDSILEAVNEEYDAILYFDFGDLYCEERNRGVGHSCVLVSHDTVGTVSCLNPGPRYLGINLYKSDDLAHAIRSRQGGISIIFPR